MGVNVLLLSTARGSGLAVNNKAKKETFMKMGSAGAGVGMGVKDYVVVFVFENEKALAQFLDSGWSGSGKRTRRPRQVRRAGLTQEQPRSPREYGPTRSPRMASRFS